MSFSEVSVLTPLGEGSSNGSESGELVMEGEIALGDTDKKIRGRVKSFSRENGFGFISCVESTLAFKRDVFLHKAQAHGVTNGALVEFRVELNNYGMPQARDIVVLKPGYEESPKATAARALPAFPSVLPQAQAPPQLPPQPQHQRVYVLPIYQPPPQPQQTVVLVPSQQYVVPTQTVINTQPTIIPQQQFIQAQQIPFGSRSKSGNPG